MKPNIDHDAINQFDQQAKDWHQQPLTIINTVRLKFIEDACGGSIKGLKIADIGCGGGILSHAMAKQGAKVTGIDMAPKLIELAKQQADADNLKVDYKLMTAEELAEKKTGQFDVVTCLEMIEHVPKPKAIIKACAKLLKPGGHAFFSTLNRHPKAYLFAIIGAEYVLSLLPKGTHRYEQFIKPSELDEWATKEQLALQKIAGLGYNPLAKTASLIKDVKVNYITHFKKAKNHETN